MKRSKFTYNEKAFTLIEVIISLVLAGIVAVVASVGIGRITQGYVISRQNADSSLNAQVGMTRIVKELSSICIETDSIDAAAVTSVSYTNALSGSHTIAKSGSVIQIDGIILIDNVTFFELKYYDPLSLTPTTPMTTPVSATDRPKIRRVDISFSMQGAQNVVSSYGNSAKIQESYY